MEPILSKSEYRLGMKAKLASLSSEEYRAYNSQMKDRFLKLKLVQQAKSIMIYYSVRNEVETVSLINNLIKMGKMVALPVCLPDRDLKAGIINDLKQLRPAKYGLMEPGPETPALEPGEIELIVVPGVAFDQEGNRLGHGAGFYDRFLAKTPSVFKLALAYDFQVVPRLPTEAHDIRMNGILTPTRYLEIYS